MEQYDTEQQNEDSQNNRITEGWKQKDKDEIIEQQNIQQQINLIMQ